MSDASANIITHLILSGGGPSFVQTLGTLECVFNNHKDVSAIKAIYACSAGAICAIFFSLLRHNPDVCSWDAIREYIIGRPWEDLFTINAARIIEAFTSRGLFNRHTLESVFAPFFDVCNIPLDITLAEFYTIVPIELHFFTFEIHGFKLTDLSHLTHPTAQLFDALHMTCSLPIFMTPVIYSTGECYMDGGVITNYPLRQCLGANVPPQAILGIKNTYDQADKSTRTVTSQSTLFDYFIAFIFRMIDHIKDPDDIKIPYEIHSPTEYMNIHNVTLSVGSAEMRQKMWAFGEKVARDWLKVYPTAHSEELVNKP